MKGEGTVLGDSQQVSDRIEFWDLRLEGNGVIYPVV